jgi:hypothetical protein
MNIPSRIWMLTFPGDQNDYGDRVGLCWNQGYRLLENGYRVRLMEDRFLPPHDEGTNSFLQSGVRVIMMERSPPPEPPGSSEPWSVHFEPAVLNGTSGASVTATWLEEGDSSDVTHPFAPEVALGRDTRAAREFSLIVHPPRMPRWLIKYSFGLFQPYQQTVLEWPQMPVPADPIQTRLSLRTYAFQATWLSVLVRGLTLLLGLAALLAILATLFRRKSSGLAKEEA